MRQRPDPDDQARDVHGVRRPGIEEHARHQAADLGTAANPSLYALLQAAAIREFDVLAIWSSSHIGRTTRHAIDVVNPPHRHGIDLHSDEDGIDTTIGPGNSVPVSFVPLARHEHEQLRERSRISLDRAHRIGPGKRFGSDRHAPRPGAEWTAPPLRNGDPDAASRVPAYTRWLRAPPPH